MEIVQFGSGDIENTLSNEKSFNRRHILGIR